MIFRAGQRVRRVRSGGEDPSLHLIPLGATGTVASASFVIGITEFVHVNWDVALPEDFGYVFPWTLAPLTDPKADEFIESLKKLSEEPLILTPEETFQIAGGA